MTSPATLSVCGVSKHFGGLEALRDVSLHVNRGEVLGLIGDNGAGKSTLMKIIAGVQQPSGGHVAIDGEPAVFTSPADAAAAGISTVYQDLALAMERDVVANFFLGRELLAGHWPGRHLGWLDRRTMRERTARELAQLHTRIPNIGARCKDLSGGQRQALAIARASTWCERVLLLDEPTSALGVEQHREVLDLIRRVRDLGTAVILVSHQMPDVLMVCDRITVLRLGSVVAAVEREKVSADDLIGYITGSRLGPGPAGRGPAGAGPDGAEPPGAGPDGTGLDGTRPGGTGPVRDTPAAPGPAETGGA
ncbi:MAG TPA: ATP-binding cassette domain-containing protein [Streptosporangiaceae bacterium]|jgi:ABC-type sugar transport system ATPase subunit